jgi:hypothetical protein
MARRTKQLTEDEQIAEAFALHAVGVPQEPRRIGFLEITRTGLMIHIDQATADRLAETALRV